MQFYKNNFSIQLNCIFFLIFLCLFFPVKIFAQSEFSLSVSPPTFEFNVKPGDIIENSIKAENLTNEPLLVSIDLRNFIATGEEGAVTLTEDNNNFSLNKWIEVEPKFFLISPKNKAVFKYKINVPQNAQPGGHFGSIVFKSGGNVTPGQSGASVSQEIGTLILVKVAGEVKESASLETFRSHKNFWEYGPITFETRIKNIGNIQIKPIGNITIKNIFGNKIADLSVEPKNILPDAIRKNNSTWNTKYLLGRYLATLTLNYGNPNQYLISTTSFYVIPYKIIILILFISSVFTYIIYRGRRRLIKALKILFTKDNVH